MLSESDRYDQTVNAIYETLTHPQAWHNVCAAIAGLIGARAVWITVRDKQLVNLHLESFTSPKNTDYYEIPGYWAPTLGIKSIESFARFEPDQKSAGFGQVSESGHVSSRHILDTGEWLIALLCEFVSENDALAPSVAQWLDRL